MATPNGQFDRHAARARRARNLAYLALALSLLSLAISVGRLFL